MADVDKIREEVNRACARHKQEVQQIAELESQWNTVNQSWHSAVRTYEGLQRQIAVKRIQKDNLLRETKNSSGKAGSNDSYKMHQLRVLRSELTQLSHQCEEAQRESQKLAVQMSGIEHQIQAVWHAHQQCRDYLEQVKGQMVSAADLCQSKLIEYDQAIRAFEGALDNMFGGTALSQAANLKETKTQYADNLKIAQNVIEQIDNVLAEGSGPQKIFRR